MRLSYLAACVLGMACAPAFPGQITTIDPEAHYPEGPLWREGKLFYVEYSASNLKTWDGNPRTPGRFIVGHAELGVLDRVTGVHAGVKIPLQAPG